MIIRAIQKKSIGLFSAFYLSACSTLGPNYQEPTVEWLANWQPDLYGQVTNPAYQENTVDVRFWWQSFNDPVLDKLILLSKQQNINLRLAGLRVLESRAKLGIADSTRLPQAQVASGNIAAAETVRRGGILPDDNQSLVSYQTGIDVGWEIDFWGKFSRSIESANASFFNSIENYNSMQVLISSQMAELYYAYRSTEQRIAIAQKNADIQKRSFEITEKVYLAGQESELDLQQAKSQYLSTLSTIPKLQISLTQIRNSMAILLARPPGDMPELRQTSTEIAKYQLPDPSQIMLTDIPANLLIRRPDIQAAAWQVAAQSAQIGIAEADYYPAINLGGTLSWSGNTLDSSSDNGLFGLGVGFSWNLFDHGKIANNIRLQDARLQQTIEQYQLTVLTAANEIDNAAITIVKTKEQVALLEESLTASERALTLANTRYSEGYSSFQRVLDAQRAMFAQAEQALLNRSNHLNAVIALYKAFGGGWQQTAINDMLPESTQQSLKERSDWGSLFDTSTSVQPTQNNKSPSGITHDE